MRPYRNPRQVYVRPREQELSTLDTVAEGPGRGLASLEIEQPQTRSNQTSFLVPLSAIATVTGAAVIPTVQGGIKDFADLSLTLPAAVCEATIFASQARSEGPKAVIAYLALALSVMHIVELLSGFGSPDKGGAFLDGSTIYSTTVDNILTNAIPDPAEWAGAAADEYIRANSTQQDLVNRMAQADQRIANQLKYQAEQVQGARNGMVYCRLALAGTLVVMGIFLALFIAAMTNGQIQLAGAIAAIADGFGNYFAILTLAGDLAMIGCLIAAGEKTKDAVAGVTTVYAEISESVVETYSPKFTAPPRCVPSGHAETEAVIPG